MALQPGQRNRCLNLCLTNISHCNRFFGVTQGRLFLCIYFPRVVGGTKTTKNVCVAFNATTEKELYHSIERMTSTEIKRRIAIFSYGHLVSVAKKENRGITEVIKMRLADSLRRGGWIRRTVSVGREDLARWRGALATAAGRGGSRVIKEIQEFLEGLAGEGEPREHMAA